MSSGDMEHSSGLEDEDVNIYATLSDRDFKSTQRLLYTSHFLSTWNARMFEFAAFLFLAAIYPKSLLPASLYALLRALSAVVFAGVIGDVVDSANRLVTVRTSIVLQRCAVGSSSILLYLMIRFPSFHAQGSVGIITFMCLALLACVEKQGFILNTVSIERDWVVTMAGGDEHRLSSLNSQMRRIDLFCKLAAPLAISLLDTFSSELAVIVTGSLTLLSVTVEYFTIARVYFSVPALSAHKKPWHDRGAASSSSWSCVNRTWTSLSAYVLHQAFLPSFALALLYLTVLSLNGQMITWLIAIGFGSSTIGVLRGVAALSELSATWLAPRVMESIGPVRAGIWCLNWQIMCVATACGFLWLDINSTMIAIGTVAAVVASRVGLWGFDLSAQMIIQEEVEADMRGTFSSQESAFQNAFEMLSFASTIAFAKPDQFRYPATISAGAVALAGVLYAAFVRMRRGHLVHLSKCMARGHRKNRGWSRIAGDEDDHELAEIQSTALDA